MDFNSLSPELQAALVKGGFDITGGVIGGIAQGRQQQAQTGIGTANALTNFYQGNQDIDLKRQLQGVASTQLDPLKQQKSRQQQAMMEAVAGGARNASPTSFNSDGSPVRSGGIMSAIPQGGFSPDVMKFFSPEARASAEGDFMKANAPFADPSDLTKLGYGDAGAAPTKMAQDARTAFQTDDHNQRAQMQQYVLQQMGIEAKNDAANGKQPGSGFWHKFAKYAGMAGAITATALTGGAASPLMVAALGAGSGALSGWGSGGGLKGTLTGAALGGLSGYAGAAINNPAVRTAVQGGIGFGGNQLGNLTNPAPGQQGGLPLGQLTNPQAPGFLNQNLPQPNSPFMPNPEYAHG